MILLQWVQRTPVQTFLLCPVVVILCELALSRGAIAFQPLGLPLMAWGFLQYRLVGSYRHPKAGGSPGMTVMPDELVSSGPYRWTRNPMYLGHLIFLAGLAVTFQSWVGLGILVARAVWFNRRVLQDEARLKGRFGAAYDTYCKRVPRWLPTPF